MNVSNNALWTKREMDKGRKKTQRRKGVEEYEQLIEIESNEGSEEELEIEAAKVHFHQRKKQNGRKRIVPNDDTVFIKYDNETREFFIDEDLTSSFLRSAFTLNFDPDILEEEKSKLTLKIENTKKLTPGNCCVFQPESWSKHFFKPFSERTFLGTF